jgi:hypothetical protein
MKLRWYRLYWRGMLEIVSFSLGDVWRGGPSRVVVYLLPDSRRRGARLTYGDHVADAAPNPRKRWMYSILTDHGWDYRRYIVSSIRASSNPTASSSLSNKKQPLSSTSTSTSTTSSNQPNVSLKAELAYTTNKISASFSNYSAWHYRSKCLTGLFVAEMEDDERKMMLDEGGYLST